MATLPIGMKASMPHHLEYWTPTRGNLLFANAHHHESTLLVDTSNPLAPRIARRLQAPKPLRYPHNYARLSNGNVLAGFPQRGYQPGARGKAHSRGAWRAG